jgi:acid phosphatase type 7
MLSKLLLLTLVLACSCQEQIHVSYFQEGKLSFTWVTQQSDSNSSVGLRLAGESNFSITDGKSTEFLPSENRTIFIHRVTVDNLLPNSTYEYFVGGNSDVLTVRVPHNSTTSPFSFLVYADYGFINDVSTTAIDHMVQNKEVDMIIHAGDLAYDLPTNNGTRGDNFMNMIQPFSSAVPYQVCPGNHEYYSDFAHYKALFTLPGKSDGMWYSFDTPNVHFVSISTEEYFGDRTFQLLEQYAWLENDLQTAYEKQYPWIVVYGHRPMYCSEITETDYDYNIPYPGCTEYTSIVRDGVLGLEHLFRKYSVDLFIAGHEHIYERLYPTYQGVHEKQSKEVYISPNFTTNIISGSAGCQEGLDVLNTTAGPWTASRSATYGIGKMIIHNSTHLQWQQMDTVTNSTNTTTIDEFWIVKSV